MKACITPGLYSSCKQFCIDSSRLTTKLRTVNFRSLKTSVLADNFNAATPRHKHGSISPFTPTFSFKQLSTVTSAIPKEPTSTLNDQKRILKISWVDEEEPESLFPYSWLRDSCQCKNCFHPNTLSRQILMRDFDPDCQPETVKIDKLNRQLHIIWNDGHNSNFGFDFLKLRSFTPQAQLRHQKDNFFTEKTIWSKESMQNHSPTFDYSRIISTAEERYNFLNAIQLYGLAFIYNTPSELFAAKQLQSVIAYPHIQNYGPTFEVVSKNDPSNSAYTNQDLGLHIDLCYYKQPPSIQCLHFLKNDDSVIGGENQFADGFHAAYLIKMEDPKTYNILTTRKISFDDYGSDYLSDYCLIDSKYPITLNEKDEVVAIDYNNFTRDTYQNLPAEEANETMEALWKFEKVLRDTSINRKLQAGEIVVFDNRRVLHGRNSFEVTQSGVRHLHGWYWRWDEVHSRLRRLKHELKK